MVRGHSRGSVGSYSRLGNEHLADDEGIGSHVKVQRRMRDPPKQPTSHHQERHAIHSTFPTRHPSNTMISDASLYSLAIFLGSASMLMIVLYHFLEINAQDPKEPLTSERKADALPAKAR
ncbi:hypothetical protein KC338_g6657 [Hortaea werneckii]|nr:hypothetical protein KC338_g6657 [Hortaea werneckii]KAI6862536.1 hypothetical protein KC323_g5411 [Hortaea werneckii]